MDVKMYQPYTALAQSLWRNGIARWTSNPEAPGSSPGRDEPDCMEFGRKPFWGFLFPPSFTFQRW